MRETPTHDWAILYDKTYNPAKILLTNADTEKLIEALYLVNKVFDIRNHRTNSRRRSYIQS